MNDREFQSALDSLDDGFLKPFLDVVYQESTEHYNKLILEGISPDEALHEVICKTSYKTLKYAAMFTLFLASNFDPDKIKSKDELKAMLKLIKS